MYALEPCVKFSCLKCRAWITAPQRAVAVVCPQCRSRRAAGPDRMVHFSLNRQNILLGKDEWVHATEAAARLERERQQVEQLLKDTSVHEHYNVPTLEDQKAALDAAIALCARQAAT